MAGLKDKVVLVTGASSGIGKGTAIHMAGIGCKLALVARYKIKNSYHNRELMKIGILVRGLILSQYGWHLKPKLLTLVSQISKAPFPGPKLPLPWNGLDNPLIRQKGLQNNSGPMFSTLACVYSSLKPVQNQF